jgi:hypothetical protein
MEDCKWRIFAELPRVALRPLATVHSTEKKRQQLPFLQARDQKQENRYERPNDENVVNQIAVRDHRGGSIHGIVGTRTCYRHATDEFRSRAGSLRGLREK